MKHSILVLAALAAFGLTTASAQAGTKTVIVKHRHPHHARTVVIEHRRHHHPHHHGKVVIKKVVH